LAALGKLRDVSDRLQALRRKIPDFPVRRVCCLNRHFTLRLTPEVRTRLLGFRITSRARAARCGQTLVDERKLVGHEQHLGDFGPAAGLTFDELRKLLLFVGVCGPTEAESEELIDSLSVVGRLRGAFGEC
jgi:hypothetical protein